MEEQSDNPGFMNIRAQIIVSKSEVDSLIGERKKLSSKLEDYQKKLEAAPFIDEEYNSLTLDYENAKKKFNEVSSKLHSAMIAQEMDVSEQGARFRIEQSAVLPDRPSKPNRLFIILLGFALGVGSGVTLVALTEGMDTSVKANQHLESIVGVPVLATVSFFDSPLQKRLRRSKHLLVLAASAIVVLVASLMINWFVMPLDDLWAKFEDRLVEIGVPIEKESKKL